MFHVAVIVHTANRAPFGRSGNGISQDYFCVVVAVFLQWGFLIHHGFGRISLFVEYRLRTQRQGGVGDMGSRTWLRSEI